jgi:hypothetical protein
LIILKNFALHLILIKMKKTFVFLVLAILMLSSFGIVLAEGNESNSSNVVSVCANYPGSDYCEEDEILATDGVDDNGCAIWKCKSLDEEMSDDENEEIEIEEEFEDKKNFECCYIPGRDAYRWVEEGECSQDVDKTLCEGMPIPGEYKYKYKYKKGEGIEEEVEFQYRKDNRWEFRAGEQSALCQEDCNLTNGTNMSQFRASFSNGRHALIKIMPDVAAERALERLRLKNCIEEEGCTIELKDVGSRKNYEEDETEVEYEVSAKKEAKVFGFIKSKMKVKAYVDAETGEVTKVKKSWWSFLASESDETEEPEEAAEEQ